MIYQLQSRRDSLLRLFVIWECNIVGIPTEENLPDWGPLEEDISLHRAVYVSGSGIELSEETGFEYDVEFEHEADGLLVEHLDSLTISENYRDRWNADSVV